MAAVLRPAGARGRPGPANHEECDMQFVISLRVNQATLDALTDDGLLEA